MFVKRFTTPVTFVWSLVATPALRPSSTSSVLVASSLRRIGFASINTLQEDRMISGYILAFDRLMARAWQEIEFQLWNFQRGFPEVHTRILVELRWNDGTTLPLRGIPPAKKRAKKKTGPEVKHRPGI